MPRNLITVAGCVITLLLASTFATQAADDSTKDETVAAFKDKILMLVVDRSNALEKKTETEYISDAAIQKIGNRFFVTGTAYSFKNVAGKELPYDWRRGSQVGVAWDTVRAYYAYSPEGLEEMMKARLESQKE